MRVEEIIKRLRKRYKGRFFMEVKDPFYVLISTLLSHRTKDELTIKVAKRFFEKIKKPEDVLKLSVEEISRLIYPVGFYRQKAKKIKKICKILVENFGGKVPSEREELLKLPGVGPKTADCVLCYAFGKDVIPVDVHVKVIAKRLGLTKSNDIEEIRRDLHAVIPKKYRKIVNELFVQFGKDICRTKKPRCEICPIRELCILKNK